MVQVQYIRFDNIWRIVQPHFIIFDTIARIVQLHFIIFDTIRRMVQHHFIRFGTIPRIVQRHFILLRRERLISLSQLKRPFYVEAILPDSQFAWKPLKVGIYCTACQVGVVASSNWEVWSFLSVSVSE